MYADHLRSRRIDPIGLGGAAVIGGAILAALINVAPHIIPKIDDRLKWVDVHPEPIPTPTPEVKKDATPKAKTDEKVFTPAPFVASPTHDDPVDTTNEPPPLGTLTITPTEAVAPEPPVAPPPPLFAAEIDPRYADDFQPPYPAAELRAEMEGVITVRVQIGSDGRVKAIESVGKPSPGFFEATRRQALSRWRFKPATRGGVAVETWKTMTVRFQMN
jgi:protein TonB